MMFHEISDLLIHRDIDEFNRRITTAQAKLAELPATAATWLERKKLKARRRFLQDEIVHIQHQVDIATEALENPAEAPHGH